MTTTRTSRTTVYRNLSIVAVALITVAAAQAQRQSTVAVAQTEGQSPTPAAPVTAPAYDVVSVKPDKSGSNSMSIGGGGDRFNGTNLSITMLLINSYPVRSDLISGLPGWTRSARFDVDAKIVNPDKQQIDALTDEQHREMVLKVLQDRFHLQAHLETKILPVYDLVAAKGGPKFTGGSAGADTATAIDTKNLTAGGMLVNDGELTAAEVPVSSLAYSLAGEVSRTVIDKTGLTGNYSFHLKWAPERAGQAHADNGQADSQGSESSIFTALEEQLGLRLQPSKGPVQTLVVDHVEMPSEN